MKIILLSLLLCLFCSWNVAAQGNDMSCYPEDTIAHQLSKKELRRRKVAKRNIHYNILGGPSYTPDFGALIGGSALVTFRMNPSDTLQKRSVLPMDDAGTGTAGSDRWQHLRRDLPQAVRVEPPGHRVVQTVTSALSTRLP